MGINLSKPIFITEIKPQTNEIVLGEFSELFTDIVELINYKFSVKYEKLENLELLARPRFSSTGFYGKLIKDKNKIYFKYKKTTTDNNPDSGSYQLLLLHLRAYANECQAHKFLTSYGQGIRYNSNNNNSNF